MATFRSIAGLASVLSLAFLGCSSSDFGVANGDDTGPDSQAQDSTTSDAPLDGADASDATDAHGDAETDVADGAPKCPTGAFFRTMGPFPVGDGPGAIAAGDLDHDGHVDLVVADGSNQVTVLIGVGDGTFTSRHDFSVGDKPLDVDLGDANGDGVLDVVVTAIGAKDVELLVGIGDGYLRAATSIAKSTAPTSSAFAKLDADDILDLAIVDASSNTLEVLPGKGDGSFAAASSLVAVGLGPLDVKAQKLGSSATAPIDLVVAATDGDAIDVVRGPAHSTLSSTLSAVPSPYAIAFGDFDVDGHLDIAAADHGDGTAIVLLADGAGGFGAPMSTTAIASAVALVTADLDADGHVDLFVGSAADVVFLKGQVGGTFAVPLSMKAPGAGLAIADFDGDSHTDVAATDPSGSVHVFLSCAH